MTTRFRGVACWFMLGRIGPARSVGRRVALKLEASGCAPDVPTV